MLVMASRPHILLGVVVGLVVSAGLLALRGGRPGGPAGPDGPLLSECDGALRRLVIHYAGADDDDVVLPTYRAFLRQLPAGVDVAVVCPGEAAFQHLAGQVGPTACRLSLVEVSHPITSWSRDRWLALGGTGDRPTTLLCPRGEDGAEVWPARKGDERVADDLAAKLPGVRVRHSGLYFDGGDFAADGETAFARPALLLRNLQRTVATREELIRLLSAWLKHRVVVLEGAPDHHVGMYLMVVGGRTVLVGDPKLGEEVLARSPAEAAAVASFLPGGADFSSAAAASFEAVAAQCRASGYRVVRIPIVPGTDGRTYVTFVNGILEQRDGRRTVYMPAYRVAPGLTEAAAAVWRELGYEVRPVECDNAARNFGTLHCLVNVLQRD
jgi:hypothetical protein